MFQEQIWGRRVPGDRRHVERHPFSAVAPGPAVLVVERTLSLPRYRLAYDQGTEGACVGFASSWMMSILNRQRYTPRWLWDEAKRIDEWPDTNPGDSQGTSVRAAMDVLRTLGHMRAGHSTRPASLADGIAANRWALTVDEIRTCIAGGVPVTLGINWYRAFDTPGKRGLDWWICGTNDLGLVRGGHCVCVYRASDRRQAVGLVNNWGTRYPLVWMPYATLQRLLDEDGEATMVTDR
jgi:hypothetical protein